MGRRGNLDSICTLPHLNELDGFSTLSEYCALGFEAGVVEYDFVPSA